MAKQLKEMEKENARLNGLEFVAHEVQRWLSRAMVRAFSI